MSGSFGKQASRIKNSILKPGQYHCPDSHPVARLQAAYVHPTGQAGRAPFLLMPAGSLPGIHQLFHFPSQCVVYG